MLLGKVGVDAAYQDQSMAALVALGMGFQCQLHYMVKNSFIHVLDEPEEPALARPRAVSEFTGMGRIKKEEEFQASFSILYTREKEEEEEELLKHRLNASVPPPSGGVYQFDTAIGFEVDDRTTVMMRNIPNAYTSSSFVELFDAQGFWGMYDFVYLPIDFRTGVNLGYAFMNFVTHRDAVSFIERFDGFRDWFSQSPKVCEVSWTDPHQGLLEHVERYRNSPVMHEAVSDDYKPRLYACGQRIAFPEPTKTIRPPRVRPSTQKRPSR